MDERTYEKKELPPERNSKALISLIVGAVSLLTALFIGMYSLVMAVPGLVIGILALKEINESSQPGKGMAWAGVVCSTATIVLQVFLLLFIYFVIA